MPSDRGKLLICKQGMKRIQNGMERKRGEAPAPYHLFSVYNMKAVYVPKECVKRKKKL